jgi:hypothetical protein
MGSVVVFRIPKSSNAAQTPRKYKEYRILPSELPKAYVEELRKRPTIDPKSPPWVTTLDDTTIAVFDVYEAYLLKGIVSTVSQFAHRRHPSLGSMMGHTLGLSTEKNVLTPDQARDEYRNLLACYALGVTLHDRRFQDAVATKIICMLRMPGAHQSRSFVRILTCDAVQAIIDKSGTASPIFLLMTSAYARFASTHEISTLVFSQYSADFKSHVVKELGILRTIQHVDGVAAVDFVVNNCKFHTHGFYEPCPLRKS